MAELVYRQFHQIYKIIAFTLGIGMMYPNQAREKQRLAIILIQILSGIPFVTIILLDMYKSWIVGDIVNTIRHSTVVGPFTAVYFKMLLMFYKRDQAKELIDEFNRDYYFYNNFNEGYRGIVNAGIRDSRLYSERGCGITVMACVMIFPLMAIILNIYNYIFKFESTKYMMHDMNKPFSNPEDRFESPYYEGMFFYTLYCGMLYIINFAGYDGFFGLCINHACLKIKIIWKSLEEALKADNQQVRLVEVIKEQHRLFRFFEVIQDTFNIWLGVIYIATMIQICTCMYHIVEGYGFDIRYATFVISAIIHIYLPCHYAAKLKAMSIETATVIYCNGWEKMKDPAIRKMVGFMIARSQITLKLTAFKIITYDLELFMSIMQTSYTMYTLLRSS